MKKLFFILFSIAVLTSAGYSQWTANYSSPQFGDVSGSSAKGKDVSKDGTGGCYVAGYASFSTNGNDILLVKYNSSGDTIWTRNFNGSANDDDQAIGSVVDGSGNIFVTGYATMTGNGKDIILLKYNSSGDLLWSRSYGGTNEDRALGLCIDASGNCIITGFSTDDSNIAAVTTLKYSSGGSLLWSAREPGNNLDSKGLGIAVDNASNIYITGYTRTIAGGNDILAIKYNSAGTAIWIKTVNGNASGDDQACAIAIDGSSNVYVCGYITMNAANGTDCALVKINSSGTIQWTKSYNGSGNASDRALGIAVDATDGCIYITGYAKTSGGSNDYITLKYNSNGNQVWSSLYSGPGNGDDQAYSVAITHGGLLNLTTSIVVTGGSWGSNNNHDFATVKYLPLTGSVISVSRYSNNSGSDDQAVKVVVDDIFNTLFVTGSSIFGDSPSSSVISTQNLSSDGSELKINSNLPYKFSLYQNYPNPFNPSTNIKFDISYSSNVKLSVYDMTGRIVSVLVNQNLTAGSYTITFSMSELSSGVYFYELNAGDHKEIKKMTLIK